MRRSALPLIVSLLLVVPVISSCTGGFPFGIRGSGDVVTETREVSGFDQIALEGSGIVNLEVTGSESLTLEAEDNLMPYLTTDVSGGRLVLSSSRSISPTEEIVYTITVISLEGMSISGSGEVTAVGVTGDRLDASISGSGSVTVPDAEIGSVSISISGSGEVEISGTAEDLELSISGSGSYSGEDLIAQTGDVRISGSGNAVVNVTEELDAEVSGSGDLEYLGDPSVNSHTSGSGNISQR